MKLNKQLFIEVFGWGAGLWLFGYILGILLFAFVPKDILGWVITPFGIAASLWVLFTHIKDRQLRYYLILGVVWVILAITLDYIFLVKAFNASDYYKLDVYLYYLLTFSLPIIVGWYKSSKPAI